MTPHQWNSLQTVYQHLVCIGSFKKSKRGKKLNGPKSTDRACNKYSTK